MCVSLQNETEQIINHNQLIQNENEKILHEGLIQMQNYQNQVNEAKGTLLQYINELKNSINEIMKENENTRNEQERALVLHNNEFAQTLGTMRFLKAQMMTHISSSNTMTNNLFSNIEEYNKLNHEQNNKLMALIKKIQENNESNNNEIVNSLAMHEDMINEHNASLILLANRNIENITNCIKEFDDNLIKTIDTIKEHRVRKQIEEQSMIDKLMAIANMAIKGIERNQYKNMILCQQGNEMLANITEMNKMVSSISQVPLKARDFKPILKQVENLIKLYNRSSEQLAHHANSLKSINHIIANKGPEFEKLISYINNEKTLKLPKLQNLKIPELAP